MHAQPQGRDNEVVDDKNPLHIGPLPSAEAHANRSFLRKQLCKRSLSLSLSLQKMGIWINKLGGGFPPDDFRGSGQEYYYARPMHGAHAAAL
jgi:hypothetical protein